MKNFHPDLHTLKNAEEQEKMLHLSSQNNTAFQILSNDNLRIEYILNLYQLLETSEIPPLPADFLMEMMELNEELERNTKRTLPIIEAEKEKLETSIKDFGIQFDKANSSDKKNILLEIRTLYLCKKYLLRMTEKASIFASNS